MIVSLLSLAPGTIAKLEDLGPQHDIYDQSH